eukprot:2113432-Amphidinium_carterae.2
MTTCLVVAAALYAAVATSCVTLVLPDALALADGAPLALVIAAAGPTWSHSAIALVGMCSGFNSALVIFGKAAGLISGLAEDGLLPKTFIRQRGGRAYAAICFVLILCMAVILLQTWQNMSETASHQIISDAVATHRLQCYPCLGSVQTATFCPLALRLTVFFPIFSAAVVFLIFLAGRPSEEALKLTVLIEAVIVGVSWLQ